MNNYEKPGTTFGENANSYQPKRKGRMENMKRILAVMAVLALALSLAGAACAEGKTIRPLPVLTDISRLGDRVRILHMKDFVLTPDCKMDACACGLGNMRYEQLLAFGTAGNLPMTLENTVPENAEAARLYLEQAAKAL